MRKMNTGHPHTPGRKQAIKDDWDQPKDKGANLK